MAAEQRTEAQGMPAAERPRLPKDYGIHQDKEGLLNWAWVSRRLEAAQNYWLCTTRPDGAPHAMPVWAVWVDGALVFSTGKASRKARNLAADPRAVVHLESGDDAVMLEGTVEELNDATLAARADAAYSAKYPDPQTGEGYHLPADCRGDNGLYALRPRVCHAWREATFPVSASRWRFDPA